MIQKKCKISLFTSLVILLFGVFSFGGAFAQETTDMPQGPAPSINATEIEGPVPAFQEPPAAEEPMPIPTHPPIDQIPPMPMPEKKNGATAPAAIVPGEGIIYNPKTKQTTIMPPESANAALEMFTSGGGYGGADGGAGTELTAATQGAMSKITNTGDNPWRMNAKLVMRFGADWFVCSGTMSDAETVLTAGHCVHTGGPGGAWADEIWVYPGWDGVSSGTTIKPYGFGYGTYFGTWSGWTGSSDWNNDIGVVEITRAAGMLTGWFGWAYGFDCTYMTSTLFNNASYPAEACETQPGRHNGSDMYYWSGQFDYCPGWWEPWNWNRIGLNTSGGCLNAVWGGMSGSGVYNIDGGSRYVHAVTSTSNRSTYAEYTRQWGDWVTWTTGTFIPGARGSAFDLQPLDVNAGPAIIAAGTDTTLLNHLATNPTNGTSASATRTYRVYLSTNDNISTADTLLSTQTYSWSFGAMGSVTVNMAQVTIPANTPAGNYWLGLIYDCATDGNCANNETDGWDAVPIQVVHQPDLIVQSITTNPTAPIPGQSVAVTVTVKNQGTANAGAFYVDWYPNLASAPGAYQAGYIACNFPLAAGATTTCTGNYIYTTAGTYSMWAQADTDQGVTESNEGNNVFGPQTITVQNKPDLIVQSIATNPTAPTAGQSVAVTVTVKNQGLANAGAFIVDWYANLASAPGAYQIGNFACGLTLAAGATTTCTGNYIYTTAGTYSMWAQADTDQGVTESNEGNNVFGPQTITVVPVTYTLTVTKAGTGSGTVTSSPAGISCGADCTEPYNYGTLVTLTATPATGSTFASWSGACTGTGACAVTMDAAKTVTATFNLIPYTLTVTKAGTGSGTVTSSPVGISCGADCTEPYNYGTLVTLTATPATGSTFAGWSGACTGTGACTVTMNAAKTVTATFTLNQYTLTVTKAGTGSGTVTSSPAGISCGADCTEPYNFNTIVTLTAAAATGSSFGGWSGACTGTGACTVTMDAAKTVTATFNLPNVTITLKPDSTSVPRGGTLGYTVTGKNNTTTTQTFQYWTYVILPDASRYPSSGELYGPVTVTLTAGQVVSAHLTHGIPTNAPLGTYVYYAQVGPYPTVWNSDGFKFDVTAIATATSSVTREGWELLENGLSK